MHPITKAQAQRVMPDGVDAETYTLGFDCALNGPTADNCHFSVFSTPHRTASWEQGQRDAEHEKAPRRTNGEGLTTQTTYPHF